MLRRNARIWWEAVKKIKDVVTMTWAEFLREFNSIYYSQTVVNSKVAEFTRLQQGNLSVLEYVWQFDQLLRYAPDMVHPEMSKVWRFLSGLHLGLAGLVDTRRDGPESYADVVGRATRQESWMKTDKSLSFSMSSRQKEVLQSSPLQAVGNQRSGKKFQFQPRKPNNQDRMGGPSGKPQVRGKGRVGRRTRVGQSNLVLVDRLDEILSNGHCVTSARGNI